MSSCQHMQERGKSSDYYERRQQHKQACSSPVRFKRSRRYWSLSGKRVLAKIQPYSSPIKCNTCPIRGLEQSLKQHQPSLPITVDVSSRHMLGSHGRLHAEDLESPDEQTTDSRCDSEMNRGLPLHRHSGPGPGGTDSKLTSPATSKPATFLTFDFTVSDGEATQVCPRRGN
jgi:hypothetical protein